MLIKNNKILNGVFLTPLKKIAHSKGDVFHAMKSSDKGFSGFGEAYFSTVQKSEIKGWKKHTKMILNIVVPIGEIEFVIYDENSKEYFNIKLSQNNYQRLTIKAGIWLAFRGLSDNNMLLNMSSIEHDPEESVNKDLDEISYDW